MKTDTTKADTHARKVAQLAAIHEEKIATVVALEKDLEHAAAAATAANGKLDAARAVVDAAETAFAATQAEADYKKVTKAREDAEKAAITSRVADRKVEDLAHRLESARRDVVHAKARHLDATAAESAFRERLAPHVARVCALRAELEATHAAMRQIEVDQHTAAHMLSGMLVHEDEDGARPEAFDPEAAGVTSVLDGGVRRVYFEPVVRQALSEDRLSRGVAKDDLHNLLSNN